MLRSMAIPALRAAAAARATSELHAVRVARCFSYASEGYAVDAPDGAHDLQDMVRGFARSSHDAPRW